MSELSALLRDAVKAVPSVRGHLSVQALRVVHYAIGDMTSINAEYHDAITDALLSFFERTRNVVGAANAMKRACSTAFNDAGDTGWIDGGADLPRDEEAVNWVNTRVAGEFVNIDSLFEQARELRDEPGFDYFSWITARADAYTSAALSVYNGCVLLAKGNQMLTWHLGNTEVHCDTCFKLDGNSHRASWYISHDYIPRKPGAGMDCHGYNCDCSLTDRDGNEVTL